MPTLPSGAIVAIWFGYNGSDLTLRSTPGDDGLGDARCVNGSNGNVFGQFAYCNAPAFFTAANAAVTSGKLKVPAAGTASDGKPCPTVRDFFVVDQDQSDNLPTQYLVSPRGHMSQFTKRNRAAHPSSVPIGNPSDNRLTDAFVDPALGCKPWVAPDLADPGSLVAAFQEWSLEGLSGGVDVSSWFATGREGGVFAFGSVHGSWGTCKPRQACSCQGQPAPTFWKTSNAKSGRALANCLTPSWLSAVACS